MFRPIKKKDKPQEESINSIISRIKDGDMALREEFIIKYKPFMLKAISSTLGRYIDIDNSEEYSIGLIAFNEAIDGFSQDINGNFFNYCSLVINHRLIDYIRKNKRSKTTLPFSYFEEKNDFEERYLTCDSHYQYENIEIKEEIDFLEKQLKEYGISFMDLVASSPKHKDSRELYVSIARILAENNELFEKMVKKKRIPLSELMNLVNVHRKTIERNRKFIMAVSLILRSGLEEIKGFFSNTTERSSSNG